MTVFQTPVTLMSIVSLNIAGVVSSHVAGMQIPALATTMSSRPSSATPRSTKAYMSSKSRTSPSCVSTRRSSASTARAVSARSSGVAES